MSKYFKTSDGEEFYTENHAYNHARSLKDKTVTPPSIVVEEQEEDGAINLSKMTKKQLVEFALSKEIEVDAKATNADIIIAIENALSTSLASDLEVIKGEELIAKTEE